MSLVGTRRATPYGKRMTRTIVHDLVRQNWTIVSGLAFGIDIQAHRSALEIGGYTIAVLPSGLDNASIAPQTHLADARRIVEADGLLISEYPPGIPAHKSHFPIRNRVIAGLSRATIIVEATVASGSLITARAALQENREVCAVPGPADAPGSAGPHTLIQQGAQLVTCARDILATLSLEHIPHAPNTAELRDAERALLAHIDTEPTPIDDLPARAQLPVSEVSSLLLQLEFHACIQSAGAGYVMRIKT